MYDIKGVGLRIRQLRKEMNMTQEELGSVFGSEASTICRIEKGTQAMSIDYVIDIADYFGVTVNFLLCGEQMIDNEVTAKYNNVPEDKRYLVKKVLLGVLDAFVE